MDRIKLTKGAVERIKPEQGKQIFVWDSDLRGFGLRVSPGGAKAYIMQRRVNGKNRRVTIGRADDINPETARKRALKLAAEFSDGKDPVQEKRRKEARSISLREAFEDYIAAPKKKGSRRGAAKKPRTLADIRKAMRHFEDWLDLPASEVTGAMVKKRHAELVAKSAAQGNLAMRYLRAAFNHLMADYDDEDDPIIKRNPVDRLNRLNQWAEVGRASGHIPEDKLAEWLAALDTELLGVKNPRDVRDTIMFLLLTGARIGETLGDPMVGYLPLAWNDVDLERGTFTLLDTKNRTDHTLPLPRQLAALLTARRGLSEGPHVFASRAGEAVSQPQVRRALKRVGEAAGVTVTPHDLRRTFATIANKIDIAHYKLKKLTNHVSGGDVTAGYVQVSTEDLRDAMQRIEDYILSPARTSEGNVVSLEAAR